MSALVEFAEHYASAFEAYRVQPGEATLRAAYELGRAAVGEELSVLDLASVHHDALADALRSGGESPEASALARSAGEFFAESLSAFEMVQRVLRDAREAAMVEQQHAVTLRRLSSFLADASLALDATGSMEEMLQLVAEHARELIGAEWCSVRLSLDHDPGALEAVTGSDRDTDGSGPEEARNLAVLYGAIRSDGGSLRMTSAEIAALPARGVLAATPPRGWLAAPLTRLDGRGLGLIQLFNKEDGDFSQLDEALLVQLAQMASAAVERVQLYGRQAQ